MVRYMNRIVHYRNHMAQKENRVARHMIHISREAANLLLSCTVTRIFDKIV